MGEINIEEGISSPFVSEHLSLVLCLSRILQEWNIFFRLLFQMDPISSQLQQLKCQAIQVVHIQEPLIPAIYTKKGRKKVILGLKLTLNY